MSISDEFFFYSTMRSHIGNENHKVDFPNLNIIFLSSNIISKLQSMNVDIIASFKCHCHKCQLEYVIDMIDAGKNSYKIDQLIAMRWSCMI